MTSETPPGLHELLGAYALDAIDEREREEVEQMLDRDPVARREVDELREAAAMLAVGQTMIEPVPPTLWARIESELGLQPQRATEAEPGAAVVSLDVARRSRRVLYRAVAVAAAVALVAGVGVGLALRRSRSTASLDAAYASAKRHGVELTLASTAADHRTVGHVAFDASSGDGYLRRDAMAALGPAEIYQLWVIPRGSKTPVSVGVLGNNPAPISAFHWAGPVGAVAVSVEPAPASAPSQVVAVTT